MDTELSLTFKNTLAVAATNAGLKVRDMGALADACAESGLTVFTIATATPEQIADRLAHLSLKRAELFEAPAGSRAADGLDDAYGKWLGGLRTGYQDLPATKKHSLMQQYAAAKDRADSTTAQGDALRRQLEQRHGPDWRTKATKLDLARLADLEGTPRTKTNTGALSPSQIAAINAIRNPADRLAAHAAAREHASLANSTREIDQTRRRRIEEHYGRAILAV